MRGAASRSPNALAVGHGLARVVGLGVNVIGEFELIERWFSRSPGAGAGVRIGVGDDCALLQPPPGKLLAVTVDTLVAGRHFLVDTDPADLGWKALAVNLSDLAAMAARPAWATLALTLPEANEAWLDGFSHGFWSLAERYDLSLVGGDVTRGPLTVTIELMGVVAEGDALLRSGAKAGHRILVSGTLGDAAAGLAIRKGELEAEPAAAARLVSRHLRPQPQVEAGLALGPLASAAIDISDGLAQDLGHVLDASGVGAQLHDWRLPISDALLQTVGRQNARRLALAGGDDYELCVCCAPDQLSRLKQVLVDLEVPVTEIGVCESTPGLRVIDSAGRVRKESAAGYSHF